MCIRDRGNIIVDGNIRVRDINKKLDWKLPESGSKTLNGVIVDYLEDIPKQKICLTLNNYRMEILNIEDNTITKVRISKIFNKDGE